MPSLISPDDQDAIARTQQLAALGADGVAGLLALFGHRSWAVRRGVVAALSRGDSRSLLALTRALVESREHEPTLAGIVDALSAASAEASPLVSELLGSSEPAVLCDAIQIAGRRQERACLPRLIELSEHPDDNVALAAVEALGRLGGEQALDQLIRLAESNQFFRVFPAIEGLGRSHEARALPTLRKLVKQPIYAAEAARAIGRLGSLSAVASLMQALDNASESLLRVIALSLSAIQDSLSQSVGNTSALSRTVREHAGPAARERVARALGSTDAAEAIALGRLLVWLADEENVADFIRLLHGADDMAVLTIEGLTRLSALGDPWVLAELESSDSEVRARLLPVLMGVAAGSSAIVACLSDPQAGVRALACHALARSNATAAVPRLFELLVDPDLGVVHAAVCAIQSLGSAETERLALAAARSANLAERRAALRIVVYLGYAESFELCLAALASDDERLRDIALGGLPALEEPRVPAVLIEAARHAASRTRASAIRALGHVEVSSESEAALRAALDDPDAWVRYYACQSLGRRRVNQALPLLVARLGDPAAQVQLAAVEALAALPGRDATQALASLAVSSNLDLLRAALVGIGERKDEALRDLVLAALKSPDSTTRTVALSSYSRFEGAEAELERVSLDDTDPGVRQAAIELLGSRESAAATQALIHVVARGQSSDAALLALRQNVEARIPSLLAELERADDTLARQLLLTLSSAESRHYRAALEAAFSSNNVSTRRATARVLSLLADDAAKSSLARAAALDTDPEVRRISAAAIA